MSSTPSHSHFHTTTLLTLAGVLAEEGSKEHLIIGCWNKELAEALKASDFKVFP